MKHTCHAHACKRVVPPRMFMCREHWFALPGPIQRAVWREYRPGQERDKKPSPRYLVVVWRAIGELAFKPHDEEAARIAAPYLLKSEALRQKCILEGLGDPLQGIRPLAPTSS